MMALALALALLGQDPPLNADDPIVEAGMIPFRWVEASSRRAGFGYERRAALTFHRVSQRPGREPSGVSPYWMVRVEVTTRGPSPAATSVWIDGRRCDGVTAALELLTEPPPFEPYGADGMTRSSPMVGPHAEQWVISQYGEIGGQEVRVTQTDHFGAALGPILLEAETLLGPCLPEAVPTVPPAATS
jgi:hypothetical protein